MSSPISCMACGEQGHKSSHCKNISLPPEGFYTGGGGGGHSHDDDDENCSTFLMMPYKVGNSKDDEIQSRLQMQRVLFHASPNTLSSEEVLKA